MNFFKNYYYRYLEADQETRDAALLHWKRCHAENLLSGREDLIVFSAEILAMIILANDEVNGIA